MKNVRGASYGPLKIFKKRIFSFFRGPIALPPYIFQRFWGHFQKANFLSTMESHNENDVKLVFWGVNWKIRVLGFLIKNLKLKTLIFGSFRPKMKKKLWMDSERKWKVCLLKVDSGIDSGIDPPHSPPHQNTTINPIPRGRGRPSQDRQKVSILLI